jgi:intergrase/recombinase
LLRKISEPKRKEITGGLRKISNQEVHRSLKRVIKSRRMRWAVYVAGFEKIRNYIKIIRIT